MTSHIFEEDEEFDMSNIFDVETVMHQLRENIKKNGDDKKQLSYDKGYYAKKIDSIIKEKEVVIFGCGVYGKLLYDEMKSKGANNIKCFCDNNRNIVGTAYKKCEVKLPEEAVKCYSDACYVITPLDYESEILIQLVSLGIDIKRVYMVNMLYSDTNNL